MSDIETTQNNLFMNSTAVISARTEATSYEATNLSRHELFPGWRSADKALNFVGNNFAFVADDADFDFEGDFTFETLVNITSLDTEGIATQIYNKGDSIQIAQEDDTLRLTLWNSAAAWIHEWTIPDTGWYIFKFVFDVSVPEVSLFVNRVDLSGELASSGTAFDADDPIDTNAIRVTIGATDEGIDIFTGQTAYAGIAPAEYDNTAYLDPALTAAYWPFDSDDLTDISGNGHTLTSSISLELNGTDEYASLATHVDFDVTTAFTFESLFTISSLATARTLYDKRSGTDGMSVTVVTSGLIRVRIDNSATTDAIIDSAAATIVTDTWYRLKIVYDGTGPTLTAYLNGASLTMNVASGTLPAAVGTTGNSLYIGADGGAAAFLAGKTAFSGISGIAFDNGTYLLPSNSAGYWNWDAGDLVDISSGGAGGHTLTGTGLAAGNFVDDIASGNFVDTTAYHFLGLEFTGNQNPTAVIVDSRHNLTGSATVKLYRGDWHSTTIDPTLVATLTAAADTVIIDRAVSGSNDTFWFLEIHDPDNPDGFLALPYVYLGSMDTYEQDFSFNPSPRLSESRAVTSNTNAIGNLRTYVLSNQIHSGSGEIKFTAATDLATLQSLATSAGQGEPFFLVWDKSIEARELTHTWLVYWLNASEFSRSMATMNKDASNPATWNIPFNFRELAEESSDE